ncbi:MAG: HEPN domain-containing protein [Syntrophales bacterium]|nr:HEPN domain-containing protein [Syntrophales bacterium]
MEVQGTIGGKILPTWISGCPILYLKFLKLSRIYTKHLIPYDCANGNFEEGMQKTIDYWREEAEEAMQVAEHLFEKKDYSYALFFGHLAVEKMLKAIYVMKKGEHAPHIHNLLRLAEHSGLLLLQKQKDALIRITAFNLESRYPDEKRSFRNKCDELFTSSELARIAEVFQWLKSILLS